MGGGWAESKLNAHCNDYVDHLVETCLSLLNHLSASQLKHQPSIIYETWNSIVESGFLALLEGFAKVYDCSTEGRALMSIDLASFSTALPSSKPKRGMQYVDMYIKVFYFPQEVRQTNIQILVLIFFRFSFFRCFKTETIYVVIIGYVELDK